MYLIVVNFDKFYRELIRSQNDGKYEGEINHYLYHKTTYDTYSSVTINFIIIHSTEVKYLKF